MNKSILLVILPCILAAAMVAKVIADDDDDYYPRYGYSQSYGVPMYGYQQGYVQRGAAGSANGVIAAQLQNAKILNYLFGFLLLLDLTNATGNSLSTFGK